MTLRELDRAMDGNELQECMAYYELEPWGEERMDLRFAMLTAFLYNSLRSRSQPELTAADFMPDFLGAGTPVDEVGSMEEAWMALTQMSGGEVFDDGVSDAEIEAYLLAHHDTYGDEDADPYEDEDAAYEEP
jgi:hypothetical protein